MNDANDHWNYVFRKIRHGNIFGSFLWGYLGVLFPNGTTKDGIPTPKSTPPTASVVSPPAWCNYLKWKMTPPWCRVDSGEASCSHLGFFWVVHLAKKPCPTTTWSLFCGEETPTWTQRLTEITSNILTNQRKASFQKQKRGRGTTSSKKKCLQQKPGEVYCSLLLRLVLNFLVFRPLRFSSSLTNPQPTQLAPVWVVVRVLVVPITSVSFFFGSWLFVVGCGLTTHFGEKTIPFGRFCPLKNNPTKDGFWGQVTPSKRLYPFWYLSRTPWRKKGATPEKRSHFIES